MKNILFFAALLCAATLSKLQAQTVSDESDMQAFARNFMAAYNREDHAALQKMYTPDAVRLDMKGSEIRGADQIAAFFSDQFIRSSTTLLLRQSNIVWSDAQHAFVARGTYEIYGKTYVYDIKIHRSGTYSNTMIQENGEWKIAKSVLTPLVKTIAWQKVSDAAAWQSALRGELNKGHMLNYEIGTMHGDPKTAYVVCEWPSIEAAQAFFASPDLKKAMQKAGVTKRPTLLVIEGE
jgi:ketosteroid isomerase-like protein